MRSTNCNGKLTHYARSAKLKDKHVRSFFEGSTDEPGYNFLSVLISVRVEPTNWLPGNTFEGNHSGRTNWFLEKFSGNRKRETNSSASNGHSLTVSSEH